MVKLKLLVFSLDPLSATSFKPPCFSPPKEGGAAATLKNIDFGMSGSNSPPQVVGVVGGAEASSLPPQPQLQPHQLDAASEHTVTLQNQLSLTSHMCSQLLYGQNNLIRAVCDRMDRQDLPAAAQLDERMSVLQQYQLELEAYYQQLYASYAQVSTIAHILGTMVNEHIISVRKTCAAHVAHL